MQNQTQRNLIVAANQVSKKAIPHQSLAKKSWLHSVWIHVATYVWCLNCQLGSTVLNSTSPCPNLNFELPQNKSCHALHRCAAWSAAWSMVRNFSTFFFAIMWLSEVGRFRWISSVSMVFRKTNVFWTNLHFADSLRATGDHTLVWLSLSTCVVKHICTTKLTSMTHYIHNCPKEYITKDCRYIWTRKHR